MNNTLGIFSQADLAVLFYLRNIPGLVGFSVPETVHTITHFDIQRNDASVRSILYRTFSPAKLLEATVLPAKTPGGNSFAGRIIPDTFQSRTEMCIQCSRILTWQLYPRSGGGFNPLTFTQNDVAVCDYFCQWAMGVVVGTLEYLDNITDPLPIFVSSFFGDN